MPIFMNYDGITGDVTAAGHEKWIELTSFQWGVGRGITAASSSSADREGSAPSVSEIVVTKVQDVSSNNILRGALGLAPIGEGKKVTIDLCKTDKGTLEPYMQFELTNTLISGYSMSSGGDRPSESLTLNFTAIQSKLTTMNPDNSTGDPDVAQYDLSTNVGS